MQGHLSVKFLSRSLILLQFIVFLLKYTTVRWRTCGYIVRQEIGAEFIWETFAQCTIGTQRREWHDDKKMHLQ